MKDGIDPVTPWMKSTSGRHVSLLAPTVDMISPHDISLALVRLVRFTGHGANPWTVARHSVVVARIVSTDAGADAKTVRTALLHDATEAYVGDLSRPLKQSLRLASPGGRSPLDEIEARLWTAIATRFDLHVEIPDVVKWADAVALGIEADQQWGPGTCQAWGLPEWNGDSGVDLGCDLYDEMFEAGVL